MPKNDGPDAWTMIKRGLGPLICFAIALTLYIIAPYKPYGSITKYWQVASYIVLGFAILWSARNIWRFFPRWCQDCQHPL
ncbi:MAG: hypothetical protein P1V97_39255, partial [Planctomycetota bacterium]|nr:hypothetical protein [Planctomycetota bacterium]